MTVKHEQRQRLRHLAPAVPTPTHLQEGSPGTGLGAALGIFENRLYLVNAVSLPITSKALDVRVR